MIRFVMKKYAFTLIELLVVIAILGILLTIMVPNFLNAQIRGKVARILHELNNFEHAFNMYHVDNGLFPLELEAREHVRKQISNKNWGGTSFIGINPNLSLMLKTYLPNGIPHDIFEWEKFMLIRHDNGSIERRFSELSYEFHFGRQISPIYHTSWKKSNNYCFTFIMYSFGPDQCKQYARVHYNTSNGIISRGDLIDGLGQPPLGIDNSLSPELDWKPWEGKPW